MVLVTIFPDMGGGFPEILADPASQGNMEHLHSFTDAKDRFLAGQKIIRSPQLEKIQFQIDLMGTAIVPAIQGRIHISAPGKQEGIKGSERGDIGNHLTVCACLPEGLFIISGVPGTPGNGDPQE